METVKFIRAEQTYPIRREVLRKNIDLPYKLEGDFDKETVHFGAFVGDEIVSIVTLIRKNNNVLQGKQFQLRGMGTLSKYRGKGFGKLLVLKSEEYLIGKDIHKIWCHARVAASGFYKSLNYNILGNTFEVPKIGPHYLMYKEF